MEDFKYVITIGRQFGCGGREIGQYVAKKLNIKYYDNGILAEASKESGVEKVFFEEADERSPSFFDNFFAFNLGYNSASLFTDTSPLAPDNIYVMQSNVLKQLAEKDSCVIVGRSADYVLRNHPCCISVYVHAKMEDRIKRIIDRKDCLSEAEAESMAEKKDKMRANYYNYYTDKHWGKADSYDLTISSSAISAQEVGDLIVEYAKMRIQSACHESSIND